MTTTVEQCLQTELHLACAKGPDTGCVIPVVDGLVMGRGRLGLTDPYLSRSHIQITTAGRGRAPDGGLYLSDLSATNPIRPAVARKPLRPGRRVTLGSGSWIVRGRPRENTWPGGTESRGGRALVAGRVMLPIMLVLLVLRLASSTTVALGVVGTLVVAGMLVVVVIRRRWRQWDEARLLLTSAARETHGEQDRGRHTGVADTASERLTVLRVPGRQSKIKLPMGKRSQGVIAVVGKGAQRYAQWIGGQIRAHGYDTVVRGSPASGPESMTQHPVIASPQPGAASAPAEAPQVVCWSGTLRNVPPTARIILQSHEVGSRGWLEQLPSTEDDSNALQDRLAFEDLGFPGTPQGVEVPVGRSTSGLVSADLTEVGPHALIVGGTGAGKSEFLTTFALSHALSYSPEQLRMILIDFKGGAGLEHLAGLPHVEHSLSDLEATQVPWLLRSLGAALRTRKRQMQAADVRTWAQWEGAPPRLLVVVDEFHVLAQTHPTLMEELVSVAAQGRSLGIHLILATQRPSGSVNAQLRATLDYRVALRCSEPSDSTAALGIPDAAYLPRVPGRALVGGMEFQTAYVDDPERWVALATELWGGRYATSSWKTIPDPLPHSVSLTRGQIGICEVAGSGCQPLQDIHGSVAVIGPENVRGELARIAYWVARSRGAFANTTLNNTDTSSGTTPHNTDTSSGTMPPGQPGRACIWIDSKAPGGPSVRRLASLLRAVDRPPSPARFVPAAPPTSPTNPILTAPPTSPAHPILVLDGATDFFSKLEGSAPPDEVRVLWERVLAAADNGQISLIATDTKARYDLSGLPGRIVRLPDQRSLLNAHLAPYLPTVLPDSDGLPVSRPGELARYVSPTAGRVLAQGFVSSAPVWAQVPADGHEERPVDLFSAAAVSANTAEHNAHRWADEMRAALAAGRAVWVVGASEDMLKEHRATKTDAASNRLHLLPPEQWLSVVPHISDVILAIEPTRELCRLLSQRYPEEAAWVMASQPYRDKQALFATGSALHFVDDSGVLVREFLPGQK